VPAGQATQLVRPVEFEKEPAGHVVHSPHGALIVPAAQSGPGERAPATKFWKLLKDCEATT
jgi:hypothetical protein